MPESALLFVLVYAVGICLTIFVRPMYGLYTYIFVFYVHPPSRWWGHALPGIRWSLLAAAVTLIAMYIHSNKRSAKEFWLQSKILLLLLLYTIWMWLQLVWVPSPYHLDGAILFVKYMLFAYLVYSIVEDEHDFNGFCVAHVLGCAIFGWLIYLAPDTGRLEGVGGPGVDDANSLAMHLSTGLIFASFLLLANKGWIRWFVLVSVPFILNGIIQTEARGAIVGLFLGGLMTVYLKPKQIRRLYYMMAMLSIVAFVGLANQAFISRMQTLTAAIDEGQEWDSSAAGRIEIVKHQLQMFADHPMGVGHQGTAYLSRQYMDESMWAGDSGDRASHNTVMAVLVDQGLPGIILFTILGIAVIGSLRRLKGMDKAGLPVKLGLYRAMVGGSIVSVVGAGLFAQNLKAEVQIWNLILLVVLQRLGVAAIAKKEEEARIGSTSDATGNVQEDQR
jgi:hypothetical protein